jgi:uncharacterized repeat protein (TIGR01451 family)
VLAVTLVTVAALAGSAFGASPSSVAGPGFTIEKLQQIGGPTDGAYTTSNLTGEVGEIVHYEIVVTNAGESRLAFSPLSDPYCTDISPAGSTELEIGESETFTCETLLSEPGAWSNQAEIEAGEQRMSSNEVLVEVPERSAFAVEKLQAIEGAGAAFTKAELAGKVGQTVDYKIVVANTGNIPLTFSPLEDANCTNVSPAGATELAPAGSETFTCEHTLTTPGQIWGNAVTVRSGEASEDSNEVFVRTIEEPEFAIEKLQAIEGSGADFTKGELTGKQGQTIDYEIVVSNTGTRTVTFSPLGDTNCTNISPAAATELTPGASETFTCEHVLTATGAWINVAEIEAALLPRQQPSLAPAVRARAIAQGAEGESIKKASSNQVIVNVPAVPAGASPETATPQPIGAAPAIVSTPRQVVKAQCTIGESRIRLRGASGSRSTTFTVRVPALGIKEITFYLDGHAVKSVTAAHANKGRFELKIDPRKLRFGAHRIAVKTVMSEDACAAIARSAVFVRPHPKVVKPKFTG